MKGRSMHVEFGVQWKQDPPVPYDSAELAKAARSRAVADAEAAGFDHSDHLKVVSRTVWHHESPWAEAHP